MCGLIATGLPIGDSVTAVVDSAPVVKSRLLTTEPQFWKNALSISRIKKGRFGSAKFKSGAGTR